LELNQLIIFTLGEEEYGLNITSTKEIIRIPEVTKLPNTPDFIEVIINLREKVIPVLDLKKRFGFTQSKRAADQRLLILDLDEIDLGIIVDDISEVVKIDPQAVEKLSTEITIISGNSVEGIVKIEQRLIILLNVQALKNELLN
jgi:purine-binding chemotaxis protein CheW